MRSADRIWFLRETDLGFFSTAKPFDRRAAGLTLRLPQPPWAMDVDEREEDEEEEEEGRWVCRKSLVKKLSAPHRCIQNTGGGEGIRFFLSFNLPTFYFLSFLTFWIFQTIFLIYANPYLAPFSDISLLQYCFLPKPNSSYFHFKLSKYVFFFFLVNNRWAGRRNHLELKYVVFQNY